jgi:hypothetical protein
MQIIRQIDNERKALAKIMSFMISQQTVGLKRVVCVCQVLKK